MDEKMLLEAISRMMDDKLKPIREDVDGLKDDVALLRSDYGKDQWFRLQMQQDSTTTKDAVKIIKEDVRDIKRKVGVLYDWVDGIDLKVRDISDFKKTN